MSFSSRSKMNLQISVFLLFILFPAGHSLYCYECESDDCEDELVLCPKEASICKSETTVTQTSDLIYREKRKSCETDCHSGSMNLGSESDSYKASYSCCRTSLCNAEDAPDPRTLMPNRLICYTCDGSSCSRVISCSGSEDRCLAIISQTEVVKGCASKSLCDYLSADQEDLSCCEGHLCNDKEASQSSMYDSEESATQSSMYDSKEIDFQSVTNHKSHKNSKKLMCINGAKSVTQSFLILCFQLSFKMML